MSILIASIESYRSIRESIICPESKELLGLFAYLPSTHIPMALFTGFEEAMHDFPKQVKPSYPETKLFAYVDPIFLLSLPSTIV